MKLYANFNTRELLANCIVAELIGKLYVHEDLLGSPAYFTKGNGQIFAYAQLDEWGKPLTPEVFGMNYSGLDKVADYTGHTYDRVLEQYFAQARMYDPVNKRFISEDTYEGELEDSLSLHRYAYVHNNPVFCFLRGEFENMGISNKSA